MAITLTFGTTHYYGDDAASGITVPVYLKVVGRPKIRVLAKLDTGAAYCIFERDHGEALGFQIETGEPKLMSTATGNTFQTYGHEVTVESFGREHTATVYFAEQRDLQRNVLGRQGWVRQFRLGLIDYDSVLHVSHYNDPL